MAGGGGSTAPVFRRSTYVRWTTGVVLALLLFVFFEDVDALRGRARRAVLDYARATPTPPSTTTTTTLARYSAVERVAAAASRAWDVMTPTRPASPRERDANDAAPRGAETNRSTPSSSSPPRAREPTAAASASDDDDDEEPFGYDDCLSFGRGCHGDAADLSDAELAKVEVREIAPGRFETLEADDIGEEANEDLEDDIEWDEHDVKFRDDDEEEEEEEGDNATRRVTVTPSLGALPLPDPPAAVGGAFRSVGKVSPFATRCPDLESADDDALLDAAKRRAFNNEIILATTNAGGAHLAANLVANLRSVGVEHYLLFSNAKAACERLTSKGGPSAWTIDAAYTSYLDGHPGLETYGLTVEEGAVPFRLWWARLRYMERLVGAGYNVMYVDTDASFRVRLVPIRPRSRGARRSFRT
jgi:hypothetical protein